MDPPAGALSCRRSKRDAGSFEEAACEVEAGKSKAPPFDGALLDDVSSWGASSQDLPASKPLGLL